MEPGFRFVVWNDVIRREILADTFEKPERDFVQQFLGPGMVVLDIGAYHGLYAMTASVKVGTEGRVVAFEPSPRQRKRLEWHVRLNRCRNVRVEPFALGKLEGEETLFAVRSGSEGYSSLRRPNVGAKVTPEVVHVTTVDKYLMENAIARVDFIKLDVEGGELDVLKGAERLLSGKNRPIILCELEDSRTEAWGYSAAETAQYLESRGFQWFKPVLNGRICPSQNLAGEGRNFFAVPMERKPQIQELIADDLG
jgi:FkbM family methyltransferase